MLRPSTYPETEPLTGGGFVLLAPAKINLGLRILGKRADGYHELDTLFQELTLADRMEFYPSESWEFIVADRKLDGGPENLVVKAALQLASAAEVPLSGRVVLHKRIPVGGGLGGGSADGAIALIGLSRLWRLNWPVGRLQPLAAAIGSDCAFFLHGGLARGRGRGEELELLEGAVDGEVVLVTPPYGVSTGWAYSAGQFPLTGDDKSVILKFRSGDGGISPCRYAVFRNDLETIVLEKYVELRQIRQQLLYLGAECSMLSGSGSTVFGLFGEPAQAQHAAQQFGPPLQVRVCRTVNRPRSHPTP